MIDVMPAWTEIAAFYGNDSKAFKKVRNALIGEACIPTMSVYGNPFEPATVVFNDKWLLYIRPIEEETEPDNSRTYLRVTPNSVQSNRAHPEIAQDTWDAFVAALGKAAVDKFHELANNLLFNGCATRTNWEAIEDGQLVYNFYLPAVKPGSRFKTVVDGQELYILNLSEK
ncbi:MAG: hypothetical protein CUN51_00750 [Candidatus Thermofonsia Clade 1 bacterium]|uniref:Uncharacterized protein n=1 Tax=Candidatus Thermofonsia Clade 1 bacterium TaxID=2364210 RepID=A0A2M8P3S2_9CHLR|nr:MAG: hypothetical protein CUN51_00750 [Candidatus Thermofonsia Clade 1 bacterium]